jgi:subtilase family serine protease
LTVQKIAPQGLTPFDVNNVDHLGWSGEISLDVEWAHAIAPRAKIKLVLAKSSEDADILAALAWAVERDIGDVISMSFGEGESCVEPKIFRQMHAVFARAADKDITLIASSGDWGAAEFSCTFDGFFKSASSPATDPLVTGVGGTQLLTDAAGNYVSEVVWNEGDVYVTGSGGGLSQAYAPPSYQRALGYDRRATPDVAYSAAGDGGVLVFWSDDPTLPTGLDALFVFYGTSAGSPQWAGLAALAGQLGKARAGQLNPVMYRGAGRLPAAAQPFHDITIGNNTFSYLDGGGTRITIPGFSAAPGFDLATGWGSPMAERLVPLLAAGASQR